MSCSEGRWSVFRVGGTLAAVLVHVIMDTVVVVLLAGLVAGLLRSHADILRARHWLGAGVGDPGALSRPSGSLSGVDATGTDTGAPQHIGPPLPHDRGSWSAHDIDGVDPHGDVVGVGWWPAASVAVVFLLVGWSAVGVVRRAPAPSAN